MHATIAGTGQLRGGARDTRRTEVLQGFDDAGIEQVEGALDEQLLHEGVAHLDAGPLGLPLGGEGLGGQDRRTTDAVTTRRSTEEDDEVSHTGGLGEL